jgi:hypothetical protein
MTNQDAVKIPNLDAVCADYGYQVVRQVASDLSLPKGDKSKLENIITKSLGVLQEDGIYAFFLFLDYRRKELGAEAVEQKMKAMLRDQQVELLPTGQTDYDAIRELTTDLDCLLLAHQLLEQALIYARYHAKALKET